MRKKIWFAFAGILLLTVLSGVITWPKGPDINIQAGSVSWQKELKLHLGLDLQGGTHLVYEADLSQIDPSEYAEAVEGARDVIERRVNALGVSEPVVQTNQSAGKYRIIVELAGVTDVNQAIEMIGQTPSLDFREQAPEEESTEEGSENSEEESTDSEDGAYLPPSTQNIVLKLQNRRALKNTIIAQAEEKSEDATSSASEPINTENIQIQGEGEDAQLVDDQGNPIDIEALTEQLNQQQSGLNVLGGGFQLTELTGAQLERSEVQFDQQTGRPTVLLQFNSEGRKLFSDITERNVGKPIAIFLDGQIISAPNVTQKISDGQAVISGDFTLEEAKELVRRLNAGALPVPIELVSETTVGPTLGQVSIERSFLAAIIGLILVSIFMIVYYRLPGLLSVFALIVYSLIIIALFKLIPVTLTLAGIAGFILSIGMAVDANVLIFERTREELRNGKDLKSAIEGGFKHAWTSIRDSNVSSLITCFILAWFGTSVIKGFAITLAIGIVVSMFSAISITRTFMRLSAGKFLSKYTWLFK